MIEDNGTRGAVYRLLQQLAKDARENGDEDQARRYRTSIEAHAAARRHLLYSRSTNWDRWNQHRNPYGHR